MQIPTSSARVSRPGPRLLLVAMLTALVLSATGSLLDGGAARAQQLGATVSDTIALLIGSPTALTPVGRGVYELRIPVTVSSTVTDTRLSIADGEDYGTVAQGRLHTARGLLAVPLQAPVAGGATASLASPADPQVQRWSTPLAQHPATIILRQRVTPGIPLGGAQKVLLVTLSSTAP